MADEPRELERQAVCAIRSHLLYGLETGKAWGFKELLRDLWLHSSSAQATEYFKHWYRRVIHTKLEPMKKVARMIKKRLRNIVSYCELGITNAVAEGINSKIMSIKRRVGGYRNRENFKKPSSSTAVD